jgi:predicted SnoaL-like aldol condensation-catalyzing enzyme
MKDKTQKRSTAFCTALMLTASLPIWTESSFAQAKTASASANVTAELGCSAEQIEANRALAKLFDLNGDPNKAYDKMAPSYIQHNPIARRIGEVNGASGRDEFKLLLDMKSKGAEGPPPPLPGQPPEDTYHYVMADCNHVFLLKKAYAPDPQHKGQFYETFSFDFWRIENGKLAEHWDGARIPERVPRAMEVPFDQLLKEKAAQQPPAGPKP